MAYQYVHTRDFHPAQGQVMIFDANIWIFYLQINPDPRADRYQKFVSRLIKEQGDPVILLPAMVLSEVVNRLLKQNYLGPFLQSQPGKAALAALSPDIQGKEDLMFKKAYRPSDQYLDDRNNIYTSIFSLTQNLRLISDKFEEQDLDQLIEGNAGLDFTDETIVRLAQDYNAVIVTDDGDFIVEEQLIVTNNKQLLALN